MKSSLEFCDFIVVKILMVCHHANFTFSQQGFTCAKLVGWCMDFKLHSAYHKGASNAIAVIKPQGTPSHCFSDEAVFSRISKKTAATKCYGCRF